jgi:hypothetical protein
MSINNLQVVPRQTNTAVYKQLKLEGMIPPNSDDDQRYLRMAEFVENEGISLAVEDIDFSDRTQFVDESDPIRKMLQPRVDNLAHRADSIRLLRADLLNGKKKLERPPWLWRDPKTRKWVEVAGCKRVHVLRDLGRTEPSLIIKDVSLAQALELSQLSNIPTPNDVDPITEADIIHSYGITAGIIIEDRGWEEPLSITQREDLKKLLQTRICVHHSRERSDKRVGVMVNNIMESFRKDKHYAQPISISPKNPSERDSYIEEEYQKCYPNVPWKTSETQSAVYQLFSSAETFENTKQSIDTFLERSAGDAVYAGKKDLHVAHWVKFKAGATLENTVTKAIKGYIVDYTNLNNNSRRCNDYNIPPIRRLFFPATFIGRVSRAFDWDPQLGKFVERFPQYARAKT